MLWINFIEITFRTKLVPVSVDSDKSEIGEESRLWRNRRYVRVSHRRLGHVKKRHRSRMDSQKSFPVTSVSAIIEI